MIVTSDPLRAIFSEEVMDRLACAPQTQSLQWRRLVLTASGPLPSEWWRADVVVRARAQRAAWETYLDAAFACGLLDEPHEKDLVQRLTNVDDDQFRSAMAECLAAWYFAGKLRLPTSARPRGSGASELELLVRLPDGDMCVEVKSPLVEPILDGKAHSFDDSLILEQCVANASKQFSKDTRNLLFLTGRLTLSVTAHRRFLTKALIADERIVLRFNRESGEPVGPASVEHVPDGRFLKQWGKEEKPRHTRVGGVLFVEENVRFVKYAADFCNVVTLHDCVMLHNPNATRPLPEELWSGCPQLVQRGDALEWTDGHRV